MATYYWIGGNGTWDNINTANWSNASGGAGGFGPPTSADTVQFASTSGTGTCTTASTAACSVIVFNSATIGLTLGANLTISGRCTLTAGTINLNNSVLTCSDFQSNNSNTRSVLFGTGAITVTGNNTSVVGLNTVTGFTYTGTSAFNLIYSGATGTRSVRIGTTAGGNETTSMNINVSAGSDSVDIAGHIKKLDFTGFVGILINTAYSIYGSLIVSSGMTLTAGTGATTFAATSGTQQITTNGKTIDFPVTFNGIGGTWEFADALTQGSTRAFTITNGTVKLKAGTTSTVGAFATSGSNQKYLQSTTSGSQATLSQASGTVTVRYLSIKDIAATGGATWNAYVNYNNVDQGDNTGWDFSYSPAIDNEFPVALRSFTQPKRF